MALCEPPDRREQSEFDDIFSRMTEDLDVDPVGISEVVVSSLTDIELVNKFNESKRELYDREELLNPRTETGRDLSSVYHATLLEMKKRGLQ